MEGIEILRLLSLLLIITPFSSNPVTASDADAAVSRFQSYLRIDTSHPTPDYSGAVSFLLSLLETLTLAPSPLEAQVVEFTPKKPLLLLKWPGSDPALPSLLFNSHTDVVPSEPLKWAPHSPLSAALDPDTGRIFARGSQDMKSVGLQYLEAAARLAARGFRPRCTVYFSFVPDEEIGGVDGAKKFAESEMFREMNEGWFLMRGWPRPRRSTEFSTGRGVRGG